jgi:iron complex transport system substrate-binding protein
VQQLQNRMRLNLSRLIAASSTRRLLGAVLLCLLPVNGVRADLGVVDDSGQSVMLQRPATRIVSLAPHITELLFAAGAGNAVVGVSEHSDYPAAARMLPRVGSGSGVDLEAVLALRPELVVAWGSGSPPGLLQRLRQLGVPVFVSEPRVMDDIATSLKRLGRLAGQEAAAGRAVQRFEERLRQLRERHAGRPPVRVFYQVWQQPLLTINGDHLVSDVIRLCGGVNVFGDLPELAPQVSVESVLQRDPQVIIAGGDAPDARSLDDWWRRWNGISAVQGGHLYTIPQELLERHTPRILDGAGLMCERLESARQAIAE